MIALGEGFTTEFKRADGASLGREICAFANATGGVILIGVTDSGEIAGVHDHNALKSRVQSVARSADPPIAVDVASVDDVLCVTVPEQHGKPYSFGGKFFLRVGATSQQMSRDEIREFFFREGLVRFDEAPCRRFSLEADLTAESWRQFSQRAEIPEDMDAISALENLHLLNDREMTNAGAWLLATDIGRFSVQAGVTCAVFRGTTKAHILDRKEFTRDVVSNFEDSMAYMQSKLNTALIPNALGREERLELPEDALREALVNAIAHRDYRSTANVQTYIFHDRLEIVSPGGAAGRDARSGSGNQKRSSKSAPFRRALSHGASRTNRQRDSEDSAAVPRPRCPGAPHRSLGALVLDDLHPSRGFLA